MDNRNASSIGQEDTFLVKTTKGCGLAGCRDQVGAYMQVAIRVERKPCRDLLGGEDVHH